MCSPQMLIGVSAILVELIKQFTQMSQMKAAWNFYGVW